MSLKARLDRLERGRRCRCSEGLVTVVALLTRFPGEPVPPIPEDLPSCPTCGGGSLVLIEELVVVEGDGRGTS
jgi:hypothetical protein